MSKKCSYDFKKKRRSCKLCCCHRCCASIVEKSTGEHLKWINLISSTWIQSLFERMGFVWRMCTTDTLQIPDRAVMEVKLLFQHQIASLVEEHNILPSLIMNFDQIPLKYAPVSNSTLVKKRIKTCPYRWQCLQRIDQGYFWHHLFN